MSSFIPPKESGRLIAGLAKHVTIKQEGLERLADQVYSVLFLRLNRLIEFFLVDSR